MSKLQLENMKRRIGMKVNLVENGRLLHIREPLGGFNEWIVLTYNLQILGQYIKENIELRKEIVELMNTYINLIAAPGHGKPGKPGPGVPPHPPNPSDPNHMFMILSHRLDENDKRFDKLEKILKDKLGGGW